MNISPRRLSKVFKEEMQTSVSDYINEVRLEKAAEMFETTPLNVNEVISRIGIEMNIFLRHVQEEVRTDPQGIFL